MFSKTVTIIIVALFTILFLNSSVFSKEGKQDTRNIGPQEYEEFDARVIQLIESGYNFIKPYPVVPQAPADEVVRVVTLDTLGHTDYDSGWNEIPDHQVSLAPGGEFDGIHLTYMSRLGTDRFAAYNYYSRSFGFFLSPEPGFIPSNQIGSGWPRVADGPNHEGMYVYHFSTGTPAQVQTHFRKDDSEGAFSFSTDMIIDPIGVWPGFDTDGNTVVITTTDDPSRIPGRTYVSTDAGVSFTEIGWPSLIIPATTKFSNAETMPILNPANPQQINLLNMESDGVSGSTAATDGGIVWSVSNDLSVGTAWNSTVVYEFKTLLSDNSYYDPYGLGASVYSELASAVSEDGTGHVVFNGSGIQFDANGDTLYPIHALVYWNSNQQQLIELSDPAIARHPVLGDSIDTYFPGRSWGMGYPHVTTGPNGTVLAAWEQAELEGPDNLRYVYGVLGGAPTVKLYATDIYAAVSADYGQTWSSPFKLVGIDSEMERLPQLGDLEVIDDSIHVHLLYFWDTNPGQALTVNESDVSIGAWVYTEVVLDYPITGIDGSQPGVVDGFQLRQNYPNPFNPATTISYTLGKTENVKLDVYNLLGEKVVTLVNGRKSAGEHRVVFDAENFSSGLYFYTLTAGDFKQTRKMVLMK